MGAGFESAEPRSVVQPLRTPLVIRPERRTSVVVCRRNDEFLCGGYKWVCRFQVQRIPTRWTISSGADVQAAWHGVLETLWLLCDEAQQFECLPRKENCLLVKDAGIQPQFARRL